MAAPIGRLEFRTESTAGIHGDMLPPSSLPRPLPAPPSPSYPFVTYPFLPLAWSSIATRFWIFMISKVATA